MSLMSHAEITCPHCGKSYEIECWDSVNSEISPEQLAKVLDGSLFRFKCPHCGEETVCFYPLLVNVMKPEVSFVKLTGDPEKEAQEAAGMYSSLDPQMAAIIKKAGPKRYRFVSSFEDLIEKIQLFQQGLDDRTVELMKYILRQLFKKEGGDVVDMHYFVAEDSGQELFFIRLAGRKEPTGLRFKREQYEILEKENRKYDPRWDEDNRSTYIVNATWAEKWLEKTQKE
jgi:ribosomal protein S27E